MSSQKLLAKNSIFTASLLSLAVMSASAHAEVTKRFIVKYPSASEMSTLAEQGFNPQAARQQALQQQGVQYQRAMMLEDYHVVTVSADNEQELEQRLAQLADSPAIVSVEEDRMLRTFFAPNDPLYQDQWHYFDPQAGINLPNAWERATGKGVTVAVLDTGYLPHEDLLGNILPGYDMISDEFVSVDGDGRDADATDPGDHMKQGECGNDYPPFDYSSSWHGTHVAGTVAAMGNNGVGVTGVAFDAQVVPVRVLGKCGGYTSDIADGIVWAAGGTVEGVPANRHPAQVINMSLGGGGNCQDITQQAINFARSKGTSVVVAAGNSNADAGNFTPSNCDGVINVAATNINAAKASYSNFGDVVDVAAPGGEWEIRNDPNGVLSTDNSGATLAEDDAYLTKPGTSMAAPHVAGVAALMYQKKPEITPDELEQLLVENTNPLTDNCVGCGSGIVDADAALAALDDDPVVEPGGVEVAVPDNFGFRPLTWSTTITVPAGMSVLDVAMDKDAFFALGRGKMTVSNADGSSCTADIKFSKGSCSIGAPAEGEWTVTFEAKGWNSNLVVKANWK
ncbi:extracellular protease [Bacterioplanes sanyensis]|uniref:S8 family peptidase n=1 Tax=Bacterioplanes sanyensis TaxID=1249553 RepID=UPI001678BE99|nr:S8 family peptidase [Bacterioplanes sanyensis]GGY59335.1 extracellular protease [Bacterioplanes sanyensis]